MTAQEKRDGEKDKTSNQVKSTHILTLILEALQHRPKQRNKTDLYLGPCK